MSMFIDPFLFSFIFIEEVQLFSILQLPKCQNISLTYPTSFSLIRKNLNFFYKIWKTRNVRKSMKREIKFPRNLRKSMNREIKFSRKKIILVIRKIKIPQKCVKIFIFVKLILPIYIPAAFNFRFLLSLGS